MASTYLSLHYHIIFATRDRAPMIGEGWRRDLHAYIGGTIRGLEGTALAVGGVADHVHLLVTLKATHSLADFVRDLKRAVTTWAKQHYYKFGWQVGYAAFSISHSATAAVCRYIANQEEHHATISSFDELLALLAAHGVEYDERYAE